ncbi:glycosyltransferase family 4 protein [Amycolatopsis sp. A133]|uniref:glycosyltransferase family 4 protein n=1 Tax=Amycolatopsis sp. A133 TaxID=3064472 RepID=UPI0027ED5C64|nr:glycosyltransferase family 4 protein [Amycolatopsis sp. A133]MDQ7808409.1 glycosyltransferase family 4 protein [Amycolatopsis sp. A133]
MNEVQLSMPLPGRPDRTVLAVADEWFPARGGISTFNRHLCSAMAATGASVYCLVPAATEAEREDAARRRVHLVTAVRVIGGSAREALSRRPMLPAGVEPDVIIGHGRITGPSAQALAEDHFARAARLHFVHMQPDQIEWYKPNRPRDAAIRAAQRTQEELQLGRDAKRIIAVGPALHDYAVRDLTDFPDTPVPLRVDPGFDRPATTAAGPRGGIPQILVLGRMEDAEVKGLMLAARAVSHAIGTCGLVEREVELLVRGAPENEGAELREAVVAWASRPGLRVTVRNYTELPDLVQADILRASLLVMPPQEEGFGLVGAEAIAAGIPVLVSDRSGLGKLLEEVLPEELVSRLVVPVRLTQDDTALWGHHIARVLSDRAAAFATSQRAAALLARERTWKMTARAVLDAADDVK